MRVAVQPFDHLGADRRLLAQPDRRAQHEDVGRHHLLGIAGHSSAGQPCSVMSGYTPTGISWSTARITSTADPVGLEDGDRPVGQALRVRLLGRSLERAVDVERPSGRRSPTALLAQLPLPFVELHRAPPVRIRPCSGPPGTDRRYASVSVVDRAPRRSRPAAGRVQVLAGRLGRPVELGEHLPRRAAARSSSRSTLRRAAATSASVVLHLALGRLQLALGRRSAWRASFDASPGPPSWAHRRPTSDGSADRTAGTGTAHASGSKPGADRSVESRPVCSSSPTSGSDAGRLDRRPHRGQVRIRIAVGVLQGLGRALDEPGGSARGARRGRNAGRRSGRRRSPGPGPCAAGRRTGRTRRAPPDRSGGAGSGPRPRRSVAAAGRPRPRPPCRPPPSAP